MAVLRRLRGVLNELFLERGQADEVLMDNNTVFWSRVLKNMQVERQHCMIKVLTEGAHVPPMEAFFGMSQRSGQVKRTVPQKAVL